MPLQHYLTTRIDLHASGLMERIINDDRKWPGPTKRSFIPFQGQSDRSALAAPPSHKHDGDDHDRSNYRNKDERRLVA